MLGVSPDCPLLSKRGMGYDGWQYNVLIAPMCFSGLVLAWKAITSQVVSGVT